MNNSCVPKTVEILLNVNSVEEAKQFYCNELNLFSFYYDYGMQTISLLFVKNPTIRLTLSEGVLFNIDTPIFSLEVENCDEIFKVLQGIQYNTDGKLISNSVFEYPLGKNILIQDPSGNKFLIVENYYPNIGD